MPAVGGAVPVVVPVPELLPQPASTRSAVAAAPMNRVRMSDLTAGAFMLPPSGCR